ncbi:MAG: hypothetical protein R2766_13285 [Saprospiraceae bacterium]
MAEEKMLSTVRQLILKNPSIKVFIVLHPTEKSSAEIYDRSFSYYSNFFLGCNIEIMNPKIASSESFYQFELGIASISSVVFERLFCGYKTLLAPIGVSVKLFEDKNIEQIVATDENMLLRKLKSFLEIENSEYFEKFNLELYRIEKPITIEKFRTN